jgi:glycosyltransferase involved in cell wall biosynthesis
MLGGFLEVKGGLLFLRAAEQVLARDPRAFFVLAGPVLGGGGEQARAYARDCFECVKQLEGRGAARFLGEVEEVGTLLRASDVLVSPSVDSHFSRPIVEAWAASKPVIAFATAHMERLIRPNVNGLLVPVGDIGLLTEAMLLLAGDAPLRSRLGAAGRLTAEEEYDEVRNTDRVVKLCAGLAGTRRR